MCGRIRPNQCETFSVGRCKIRVGVDSHPSSGQLLLGSVDNAAAPGAAFALGGFGFVTPEHAGVAVGVAVAAKRTEIKILEQIWCSSSASKLISRKIFGEIFLKWNVEDVRLLI